MSRESLLELDRKLEQLDELQEQKEKEISSKLDVQRRVLEQKRITLRNKVKGDITKEIINKKKEILQLQSEIETLEEELNCI